MAVAGWIIDKSAASRADEVGVASQLQALAGALYICPVGELERYFSARSATEYDGLVETSRATFLRAEPPADLLDRVLVLQRDLAHHHGMWHRIAIPDLLIAETALHNGLGVVHVDSDFDRIAEVRPLICRRLK